VAIARELGDSEVVVEDVGTERREMFAIEVQSWRPRPLVMLGN
jgi:hypothetical protein